MTFACKPATQLQVIKPAAISLPDHINTLATIDRSKPSSGFVDVLEGGVTGEAIHQDRDGRRRALDVFLKLLPEPPVFKSCIPDWNIPAVKRDQHLRLLCRGTKLKISAGRFKADAVIAIEKFDSNNFRDITPRKRKIKDKEGNEREETVYDAKEEVEVHLGWRIYDLKTKTIIDEVEVTDSGSDSESGKKSEKEAREALEDPRNITYRVSETAGQKYGERIAPVWITVSRTFYKKAKGTIPGGYGYSCPFV